jgi:hypothetical protein
MRLLLCSLISLVASAQGVTNKNVTLKNQTVGGATASSGITLITSSCAGPSAECPGSTSTSTEALTPTFNTTGGNLMVIVATAVSATGPAPTLSPSACTLNGLIVQEDSSNSERIWYCYGFTPSASQTVQITGGTYYPALTVYIFGGTVGSTVDKQAGANGNATSCQPASITPSNNGEVIVSGFTVAAAISGLSVSGGMSTPTLVPYTSGTNLGNSAAYLIQTTAAAIQPQWSWSPAEFSACTTAAWQ